MVSLELIDGYSECLSISCADNLFQYRNTCWYYLQYKIPTLMIFKRKSGNMYKDLIHRTCQMVSVINPTFNAQECTTALGSICYI